MAPEQSAGRSLLARDASVSHGSAAVSLSLFLSALLGAGQALVIAFIVGEGDDTDAFLAAYALYTLFAIFGSSLRSSVVPLIGSPSGEHAQGDLRVQIDQVMSRLLVVGLVVLAGMIVIAPGVGQLLTFGLPADARWTAVFALLVLAPAAFCQIEAAALAAALAVSRRFLFSALAFAIAGAIGLGVSAVLLALLGVLGAALGLLGGSIVLLAAHVAYLRRFGVRLRLPKRMPRGESRRGFAVTLLAGAAISIGLQAQLAVSLATISGQPGAITAYTYAFFAVAMIVTLSSPAIGFVALPDLVARVASEGRAAAERYLVTVSPYAFAVLVPLLVLYVAFGKPLLELVFAGSLSDDTVSLMFDLGVILEGTGVGIAIIALVSAATFALGLTRRFLWVALAGVGILVPVALSLSTFGPKAVAAGHAGATLMMAGLLLSATYGRGWAGPFAAALGRSAPAVALSAVIVPVSLLLGDDPPAGAVLGLAALAALLYALLALVLWRSVSGAFLDLLRRPRRGGGPAQEGVTE